MPDPTPKNTADSELVEIRRTPDGPGDLVGAVEASDILGVERTRIARYVKTGVMPPPVAKLRATSVWLRSDVEELSAARNANAPNAALRYYHRWPKGRPPK